MNGSTGDVVRPPKRPFRTACHECASAKVKCLPQTVSDNGKCERCQLRGKSCERQSPVSRKKRTQKTSRVAELEQKLESIVALLGNAQPLTTDASPISTTTTSTSETLDDLANLATSQVALPTQQEEADSITRLPQNSFSSVNYSSPSPPDDETNLQIFKTRYIWYFPFVIIPPSMDAQTLRQQKPFLFKAIMAAVTHHHAGNITESWKEIVDYISLHLLFKGEKSLDLLQGLLVYVIWCNFTSNHHTSMLAQMAVYLTCELSLNRAPQYAPQKFTSLSDAPSCAHAALMNVPHFKNVHILEEKRALAGCFYLNSVLSICQKKTEPMKYTAYLDKCCQDLLVAAEYPTDSCLVQIVRLQGCSVKICNTFSMEDMDGSRNSSVPIGLYVHALQSELQALRTSIPVSLQTDSFWNIHYYSASTLLYEIAFQEPIDTVYPQGTPPFQRIQLLHSCLSDSKSLVSSFLSLPVSVYECLPFMMFSLCGIGLIALSRLCLLDIPEWDRMHARSVANVSESLERVASNLEEVHAAKLGGRGDREGEEQATFPRLIQRVRKVKAWYEAKLVVEMDRGEEVGRSGDVRDEGIVDFMNLDEAFWREFMVDWGTEAFAQMN